MLTYATPDGYIIYQGDTPPDEPYVIVEGEIKHGYDLYVDGKIIPYVPKIDPKELSIEYNSPLYNSLNEIVDSVRNIMNSANRLDLSSFYRQKQMFDDLLKTGWNRIQYDGMRENFERQINSKINVATYVDLLSSIIAENNVPEDLEAGHRAYMLKKTKENFSQHNAKIITALVMYVADNYQSKTNVQILDKFITELTRKGKFEVTCMIILTGCFIEGEKPLIIDDVYTIRHPDTLDIAMLERMEGNFHSFGKVKGRDLYKQSVIIEYKAKIEPNEGYQDAYQKRFAITQSIFLSSVCSVSEKLFKIDIPDSIFISPSIYSGISFGSDFHVQYGFTEQNPTYIKDLESRKITELLKKVSNAQIINKDIIEIALERYQTAILRSKSNDSAVYYAISCLEALFSRSNAELTFKLSATVSIFFDLIYSEQDITLSKKIFQGIKRCYVIRSKYAHGEKNKDEVSKEQTTQILEICRLTIIFYMQLNICKEELIEKLEESMYSIKVRNELQILLSEQITKVIHYL